MKERPSNFEVIHSANSALHPFTKPSQYINYKHTQVCGLSTLPHVSALFY